MSFKCEHEIDGLVYTQSWMVVPINNKSTVYEFFCYLHVNYIVYKHLNQ